MNIIFKLGFKWHYRFIMIYGVLLCAMSAGLLFSTSVQKFINTIIIEHISEETTIVLIVFYILSMSILIIIAAIIQCPECHYKMFIHWFNESRGHKGMGNPYMIETCPKCGYDP